MQNEVKNLDSLIADANKAFDSREFALKNNSKRFMANLESVSEAVVTKLNEINGTLNENKNKGLFAWFIDLFAIKEQQVVVPPAEEKVASVRIVSKNENTVNELNGGEKLQEKADMVMEGFSQKDVSNANTFNNSNAVENKTVEMQK